MDYKTMNTEIKRNQYNWSRIRNLDDMRFKAETWTDDIPGIEIFILDPLNIIKFDKVYVCYWDACNNDEEDIPPNWELTYVSRENHKRIGESDGLDVDTPIIFDKWGTRYLLKDVLENLRVYVIDQDGTPR